MSIEATIQLQTSAILEVPVHKYNQYFTFVVNGEEFQTTKIISDLLSRKISQIHNIDPIFDSYTITTKNHGHFAKFLQLVNFSEEILPSDELPFLSEIFDNLQTDHISLKLPPREEELTITNVIKLILKHERNSNFYSKYLNEEIEFISQHFYEIDKEVEKDLKYLKIETIEKILEQKGLQIRDENQLLNILNDLYQNDSKYSILYKYIYFSNVDEETISEFIDQFDINDLDQEIWHQISIRLKQKVEKKKEFQRNLKNNLINSNSNSAFKEFTCHHDNKFEGIINFLNKESNNNINNLININASSFQGNSYTPYNVCLFDDKYKDIYFVTNGETNPWICFDFKDHKIVPTNYLIKTYYWKNSWNPKTWILEISNDRTNWEIIDEQRECPHLNGQYFVHTFDIQKPIKNPVRYIRMKQTGTNHIGNNYFSLGSIEFYGKII